MYTSYLPCRCAGAVTKVAARLATMDCWTRTRSDCVYVTANLLNGHTHAHAHASGRAINNRPSASPSTPSRVLTPGTQRQFYISYFSSFSELTRRLLVCTTICYTVQRAVVFICCRWVSWTIILVPTLFHLASPWIFDVDRGCDDGTNRERREREKERGEKGGDEHGRERLILTKD